MPDARAVAACRHASRLWAIARQPPACPLSRSCACRPREGPRRARWLRCSPPARRDSRPARRLLRRLPRMQLVPGDIAKALLGPLATQETVEEFRRYLGLDQPILEQYVKWLWRALHGDLGRSFSSNMPVSDLLESACTTAPSSWPARCSFGYPARHRGRSDLGHSARLASSTAGRWGPRWSRPTCRPSSSASGW